MEKQSIYEMIKDNIGEDGKLSKDFALNDSYAPNALNFAPGALDGCGVYGHYNVGANNPDGAAANIVRLVKEYLETDDNSLIEEVGVILAEHHALSVVDIVLNSIRDDHEGMDLQKLIEFAFDLAKTSWDVELVKLGISFLGLFDFGDYENIKNVVAILALYDEFTLFSVVAASKWSDGNGLIFWIAQRVDAWGKIHAVERLEPETETIREWILKEGCTNGVMDAYLGLTCAVKGDLISALRQDSIDDELFESIAVIIDALLDEGPVEGISEYEHAEEALALFLQHAEKHTVSVKHLWHILNVMTFIEDSEIANREDIMTHCSVITSNPIWKERILATIDECDDVFYAVNTASRISFDITDKLLPIIKQKPLENSHYVNRFFDNPSAAAELIALYESVLPLDEMASGMGDYLFSDRLRIEYSCLDYILPCLAAYPLQGLKLLKTGLSSPVVRTRNMACRALSGWVKLQGKPIADISPELFTEIEKIHDIEVNEQTKETLRKLINGETADADESVGE